MAIFALKFLTHISYQVFLVLESLLELRTQAKNLVRVDLFRVGCLVEIVDVTDVRKFLHIFNDRLPFRALAVEIVC